MNQRVPLGVRRAKRTQSPLLAVLHCAPISVERLDMFAAAGTVIVAPCGEARVPLRPPFPHDAVCCPICFGLAGGSLSNLVGPC